LTELKRNRVIGGALARKISVLLGAALVSAALTACGGGGDDSPVAAAVNAATSGSSGALPSTGVGSASASNGGESSTPATGADEAADGAAPAGDGVDARVASAPGATTLSWTPPTETEDGKPLKLKGYRIYWGPMEGYYPYSVTVRNPGLTRYVVEQLAPATWYFVATALSEAGESEFSNVIAMQVR
jgi:hypothetical protein